MTDRYTSLRTLGFQLAICGAFAAIALQAQDTRPIVEPVFPPACTQLASQLSAGPAGLPASSETALDTARIQNALGRARLGRRSS
jgi:hypothetical protein